LIISDLVNLIITATPEEGHRFNWGFVAQHAVNFVILFAVLAYYLKDPIKNFLIERRSVIGNAIDEAQKVIVEAKKRYEEYAEKMGNIDEEIRALRETIQREGETERAEILGQAEAASQKIKAEVRETVRLEAAKARQEIRLETISSAIKIAEEIIKQNLKDSDEGRLFDDFIKKVEEEKWRQSQH
jgi:F-type H+-transporting ATPase subunit b